MDRSPERLLMALIHQEFGDYATLDVAELLEAEGMGGYRVEYDERDNTLRISIVHEPAHLITDQPVSTSDGIYSPDEDDTSKVWPHGR